MQRDEPTDRDPVDAAIAARAEDFALVKKRAKFYGWLALANLAAFALVLKGMPMHVLWPILGPVLGISLVCISATAGRYFVMHLSNLYDARKVLR